MNSLLFDARIIALLFTPILVTPTIASSRRDDNTIGSHAVRFAFIQTGSLRVQVPAYLSHPSTLGARVAGDFKGVPSREVLLSASVDIAGGWNRSGMYAQRLRATADGVSGTVLDSVSRRPIAGAVVMLADSSHAVLARVITDERGYYRVSTHASARYLRVVRIGFQPREFILDGGRGNVQSLDVVMVEFSTELATVRVADRTRCPRRSDAPVAAALWEQARAGLLASVVAREANPAALHGFAFERTFDGGTDRITRFRVAADSTTRAAKSFTAGRSAEEFASTGFSKDSAGTQILFAPDADVLLNDAFSAAYCFRVAGLSKARPREVGLAFTPAEKIRGRLDIDGTLWLDTAARALTDIEYRYVGLPAPAEPFHPGGRISFRTMVNGISFIDRWTLRTVAANQDTIRNGSDVYLRNWLYATENGGELARADWPDGQSWRASLGSIEVHAVSSAGKPVSGVLLTLAGTTYRSATDSTGNARIRELVPGPYSMEITDERLAPLGLTIPTNLQFIAMRDSVVHGTVKVRTAEEYVFGRCFRDGHYTVGANWEFVLGRVVTPDNTPIENARVSFDLQGALRNLNTDSDGVFQVCAHRLPDSLSLRVRVNDESVSVKVLDVSRHGTEALTVVPIKIDAAPPAVKRP